MAVSDYNPNDLRQYDDKSGVQMLAEIGRLLLVLLLRLLKLLWSLFKKGLKFLLKWICKGLLLLIDATQEGIERVQTFWHDNDTQAKVRKTKRWLRRAARQTFIGVRRGLVATGRGLLWLGRQTLRGLLWLLRGTVQAVTHIGPTLKAIGRGLRRGARAFWAWLVGVGRGFRLFFLRRKSAYRHFRQNKGFKGLLIDIGLWLKGRIDNYIEEERSDDEGLDADSEAMDDYLSDETTFFDEDDSTHKSRVHTFGRSIYNAMKRIVEDD